MSDPDSNILLHSFYALRRAVGIMGMALPPVVIIGVWYLSDQTELLSSVSASYHSGMRNVFVGCLCAIGVFLLFYKGPELLDDVLTIVAGLAAIGIALCPTRPAGPITDGQRIVGYLHIGFAALFFLILAYMSIWRFTKEDQPRAPGSRKPKRNIVYRTCGVIILVCLVFAVVLGGILEAQNRAWHPTLWLEAVAIIAFGVSWLVKGHWLIPDPKTSRPTGGTADQAAEPEPVMNPRS